MEKPAVIGLMPVKDEVDILPITLPILSRFCDHIIIADQMSSDGSREVYKQFPKVQVIDNKRIGHSNQVRWELLAAAREFDGNNLLIALDADEYIPPKLFEQFVNTHNFAIGQSYRFPWIQMWKSVREYNVGGIWKNNYQRIAWVDDRSTKYDEQVVINDHVARVPSGFLKNCIRVDEVPIIHLQWVSWRKVQLKQAWYRCAELIKTPERVNEINYAYSHSLENKKTKLRLAERAWTEEIEGLNVVETFPPTWHQKAIYEFFDIHGIEFFEPLQIWHIDELADEFRKRTGRNPESVSGNTMVNSLKNMVFSIKKTIRY